MTARMLVVVALVSLASGSGVGATPAPSLPLPTVRPDRLRVLLGESLSVTVAVVHAQGEVVGLVPVVDARSAFRSLGASAMRATDDPDGRRRTTFTMEFAATMGLGKKPLPALTLTRGAGAPVLLAPVTVEIAPRIVPFGGDERLRELAPTLPLYVEDLTLVWFALGAGATGVLAAFTVRRARQIRARAAMLGAIPAGRRLSPGEAALARLAALEAAVRARADRSDLRDVYFDATATVKEFLGERHGFDARELTSTELLRELDRRGATGGVAGELPAWLAACDLVKYAGLPSGRSEAAEVLSQAVDMVCRVEAAARASGPRREARRDA
ncbi:MAG: hypothetical protein EXR73_11360 [Myxococcales bacterium]|nr:hypothetical protein [Myxococcales bacterium]